MIREVDGGNGYSGQSTTRLHFGLGTTAKVGPVEVRWPDGSLESFSVRVNGITRIEQGRGSLQTSARLPVRR
jgi:enediyne biosynthesis protein E4